MERLKDVIENQAKGEQIQELLLTHLAFDNGDEDCQELINFKFQKEI